MIETRLEHDDELYNVNTIPSKPMTLFLLTSPIIYTMHDEQGSSIFRIVLVRVLLGSFFWLSGLMGAAVGGEK